MRFGHFIYSCPCRLPIHSIHKERQITVEIEAMHWLRNGNNVIVEFAAGHAVETCGRMIHNAT